jgi:hypothetical protein
MMQDGATTSASMVHLKDAIVAFFGSRLQTLHLTLHPQQIPQKYSFNEEANALLQGRRKFILNQTLEDGTFTNMGSSTSSRAYNTTQIINFTQALNLVHRV